MAPGKRGHGIHDFFFPQQELGNAGSKGMVSRVIPLPIIRRGSLGGGAVILCRLGALLVIADKMWYDPRRRLSLYQTRLDSIRHGIRQRVIFSRRRSLIGQATLRGEPADL